MADDVSADAPVAQSATVDIYAMAAEIEGTPEAAPAEKEAPAEAPAPKAEPVEGEKEPAEKKEAKKEDKPAAAKDGKPTEFKLKGKDGKELVIPADATFTVKVDGEEKTFTAADAFRDRQIDTRFMQKMQKAGEKEKAAEAKLAEVTAKEQQILQHAQHIASQLATMHQAVTSGDVPTFIFEYASMNGLQPQKVNEALRTHFMKQAQAWYDADEKERKVLDMEDRDLYSKHEIENARALKERTQRIHLADKFAGEAAQEAGISREEFISARAKVITERLNGRPLDVGSAPPAQVQAFVESIITTAILDKQTSTVSGLIAEIDPELKDEDPAEYQRIAKIVSPFMDEYDQDDLKALVRSALGKKAPVEDEEDATPIKSTQATRPRTSPAASDTNEDGEFSELAREAEEIGLDVYR